MGSNHVFDTPNLLKTLPHFQENATFKLLQSSILVSLSGAFRIYLASILLQTNSSLLICIAGFLIIYSVYVLDRSLDSQEDSINRADLDGSNKKIGLAVSLITFIIGASILAINKMFALAFIPLITGYLYSKGITIGKFSLKLKGGLGVKNIVVGVSWGIFIAGLAGNGCDILPVIAVFILYGTKVFINSAIDDFKDIKGDTLAGIKTLPVNLGAQKTRNLLTAMHLLSHLVLGIALIHGVIAFEPLIILYSFICGLICIQNFTKTEYSPVQRRWLAFFKDGESLTTIILRVAVGGFLA